jgi:hypothetical protein
MADAIDAGKKLTPPYGKSRYWGQMRQRDAAMRGRVRRAPSCLANEPVKDIDLILRSLPPGPREARPDDKRRKGLEVWMHRVDSRPSFETRRRRRSSG